MHNIYSRLEKTILAAGLQHQEQDFCFQYRGKNIRLDLSFIDEKKYWTASVRIKVLCIDQVDVGNIITFEKYQDAIVNFLFQRAIATEIERIYPGISIYRYLVDAGEPDLYIEYPNIRTKKHLATLIGGIKHYYDITDPEQYDSQISHNILFQVKELLARMAETLVGPPRNLLLKPKK